MEKMKAKVRGCIIMMSRHHETVHLAVVARLRRGLKKKLPRYERRQHRFPVKLPRYGP